MNLPPEIRAAVQTLHSSGYVAYVVGGSVRDFLLQRPQKDFDLVTDATPDQVCALFERAITVGKQFGVIKIPPRDGGAKGDGKEFEIASFRSESDYRDHRHPSKVTFAGPLEDCLRRDFTINGLYYDPKTARILDLTAHAVSPDAAPSGLEDLKTRVIRAIGDPEVRFREDALRLLRAVRFATTLEFAIEPKTFEAIRKSSTLITKISEERIRDELALMLKGPHPVQALETLDQTGLLKHVLPEVSLLQQAVLRPAQGFGKNESNPWLHTLKVTRLLARQVPNRSAALAWAAVLIDVGKPIAWRRNNGENFNGHELLGAHAAVQIGERLRLPRSEIRMISEMLEDQLKFREVYSMREATLQRFIRQAHFKELLALHRANAGATDGNLAAYEFCMARLREFEPELGGGVQSTSSGALITGRDLLQLGLKPGPQFAEILRAIEDLVFERKLESKEQALEYVVKHFVR